MQLSSRSPGKRSSLTVAGALLWIVLVLGLYYWIHKPVTPALAKAAAGAVLDVGTGMAFVLVASGMGRKTLSVVLPDISFWSAAERVAATALVGLGLLSLALMLLGSLALNALSVSVLLIGSGVAFLREVLGWISDLRSALKHGIPANYWERFLAAIVVTLLGITLLLALLPPTKWDVLTYHLAGAQQYVEHGRFYAVPHNHFLGFPQLADTLFAGQLALTGRLSGAAVIHWWIGFLLLMAAGGYTTRRAGSSAGWMAAATLIAMPSLWIEMTAAYVDVMPIALAVVAVSVIDQWRASEEADRDLHSWRYLVVVGVLAGFGLGVKYSVLWLAGGLGVLIAWLGYRDKEHRMLRYGLIYAVVALIVFAPWLVRNILWYDNPVYPLVFESSEMDDIRQTWYSQPESGLIYSANRWQIPILPLMATLLGLETGGIYGADIGPLYLMLLPLLALSWHQIDQQSRTTVTYAGIVSATILIAWWGSASVGSYISMQTRLVFYMFGPLAVIVAIAFEALKRLPKKPFDLYFVLRALVGMTFVFTVIDAGRYVNNSGANIYFSGESNHKERYLEKTLGWHYEAMRQVNTLPQDSTVRFLWEPRYLYCDEEKVNCYGDSLIDGWYYARRTVDDGTPDSIAHAWKQEDFDYFLVYEFGRTFEEDRNQFYTREDWEEWDRFVDHYLEEVWAGGNWQDLQYVIYRWNSEARGN